ncbi:MAG: hypothetical protein GWN17_15165, partial [Candidatus Korarchaeota archaeon]|nr:hypothetical protein [Candidatus Korarchaeota archaeon]
IVIVIFGYLFFGGSRIFDEYVFFAVILSIFPLTIFNYADYKWRRQIDGHLPDLFRSIVQAQETGMTLPQALEEVAKRDHGPLTTELRKMVSQISW